MKNHGKHLDCLCVCRCPFLWRGHSRVVSSLRIILLSSARMWSSLLSHSSWYSLMPLLKQLINYKEPSGSAVTSPRQRLPFCLNCQSWWRSETLHVFWHSGLCGPSAWGWFRGKRVDFNKQDAASPPVGLLLLLFSILQRRDLPYVHQTLPQDSSEWMNRSLRGAGASRIKEQDWL